MKKLFLILMAVAGFEIATAQTYDTVDSRCRYYYYSQWYDTCECCYNGSPDNYANLGLREADNCSWVEHAYSDYTPKPLEMLGVAVMILPLSSSIYHYLMVDTNYGPEYVYVAYWDSAANQMLKLDSVRWDTLTPKILRLPLTGTPEYYGNSSRFPEGIGYCEVYEAYFSKPVTVDSVFFIIGTSHGEVRSEDPGYIGYSIHKPALYALVANGYSSPHRCNPESPLRKYLRRYKNGFGYLFDWEWMPRHIYGRSWGPFLPIIRPQSRVEVHSADSTMGQVSGGGYFFDSTIVQLVATAEYGYVFSHWDDGDTTNPRQLTVVGDTSFTAYFAEAVFHNLYVRAFPPTYGTVTGGGSYPKNTDTVIHAIPSGVYTRFSRWDDGDTANPRRVAVVHDTTLTAFFKKVTFLSTDEAAPSDNLFRLIPNPASGMVQCETTGDPFPGGTLTLTDATGRELMRHELAPLTASLRLDLSALPAGTYFVTLATPQGSSTQKLILE